MTPWHEAPAAVATIAAITHRPPAMSMRTVDCFGTRRLCYSRGDTRVRNLDRLRHDHMGEALTHAWATDDYVAFEADCAAGVDDVLDAALARVAERKASWRATSARIARVHAMTAGTHDDPEEAAELAGAGL